MTSFSSLLSAIQTGSAYSMNDVFKFAGDQRKQLDDALTLRWRRDEIAKWFEGDYSPAKFVAVASDRYMATYFEASILDACAQLAARMANCSFPLPQDTIAGIPAAAKVASAIATEKWNALQVKIAAHMASLPPVKIEDAPAIQYLPEHSAGSWGMSSDD
jgi:hypothetical protein